ncbi:portal protein, partial [Bacillus velezensis]
MKTRVRDLMGQGDALFGRRSGLMSAWQEIAENFHPLRSDFTRHDPYGYTEGREWMDGLMTGSPVLAHRELSDQFAAMLRPKGKDWFGMTVEDERVAEDSTVKAWFQAKAATMRKIMYDTQAGFTRATKEGDGDFAAFGQTVLSVELNAAANGLLFRCWHLRDCAWAEDANRAIDTMHRKWKLPARSVLKLFPKASQGPEAQKLRDLAQKL